MSWIKLNLFEAAKSEGIHNLTKVDLGFRHAQLVIANLIGRHLGIRRQATANLTFSLITKPQIKPVLRGKMQV